MAAFENGTVDAPINTGETTEKETPDSSQGTEPVASENGTEQASGSQDTAEGGKADVQPDRRRGPSKLDTIKELRSKLRDRDQRYGSEMTELRSQIEEMKSMIAQSRSGEKKPSKTFWEAPEEVLDERFSNQSRTLKEEILAEIRNTREQDQSTSQWQQETSDAAKFIQSQKGVTDQDHDDIAEIIRSTPAMAKLSPMERAQYGFFLWQQERGITDRSALKAKASPVMGSSNSNSGPRTWTNAEVEREIASKYAEDPKHWDKAKSDAFAAFTREVETASREGRLK